MTPSKCIFVASFPRSGTHLTIDFLRKQFKECQAKTSFWESRHRTYLTLGHLSETNANFVNHDKALKILRKAEVPIIKTHESPGFEELGEENEDFINQLKQKAVFFYVVRDARQVLVSLYFGLKGHSLEFDCSFSCFLRQENKGLSWPKRWANHVRIWTTQPRATLVRYEDIILNPLNCIQKWADILDLAPQFKEPLLPAKFCPENRWQDYLFRLTRKIESTAIDSKFSSQKQSWKDLMSWEDRFFFHQEAGDMLIKLGYEQDDSWIKK